MLYVFVHKGKMDHIPSCPIYLASATSMSPPCARVTIHFFEPLKFYFKPPMRGRLAASGFSATKMWILALIFEMKQSVDDTAMIIFDFSGRLFVGCLSKKGNIFAPTRICTDFTCGHQFLVEVNEVKIYNMRKIYKLKWLDVIY